MTKALLWFRAYTFLSIFSWTPSIEGGLGNNAYVVHAIAAHILHLTLVQPHTYLRWTEIESMTGTKKNQNVRALNFGCAIAKMARMTDGCTTGLNIQTRPNSVGPDRGGML